MEELRRQERLKEVKRTVRDAWEDGKRRMESYEQESKTMHDLLALHRIRRDQVLADNPSLEKLADQQTEESLQTIDQNDREEMLDIIRNLHRQLNIVDAEKDEMELIFNDYADASDELVYDFDIDCEIFPWIGVVREDFTALRQEFEEFCQPFGEIW